MYDFIVVGGTLEEACSQKEDLPRNQGADNIFILPYTHGYFKKGHES